MFLKHGAAKCQFSYWFWPQHQRNIGFTLCFEEFEISKAHFTLCLAHPEKQHVDFTIGFWSMEQQNVNFPIEFGRKVKDILLVLHAVLKVCDIKS